MEKRPIKILVMVGPTAVGKSAFAVRLAKKLGGEIVSADSRQVYKGLDMGTGKITKAEMKGVPHHLLDVASPRRQFSAAEYVIKARRAIHEISRRGRLPIVVGGTGFYISALLGHSPIADAPPDKKLRARLAKKSTHELFKILSKSDPRRAKAMNESDRKNPRRLIRAIEVASSAPLGVQPLKRGASKISEPNFAPTLIGLTLPQKELRRRITIRLFERIRAGMIGEAKRLHKSGLSWKRMEELGLEYRYLARHLTSRISRREMVAQLEKEIWRYAKRQIGWFKRDKKIRWFSVGGSQSYKSILKFLRI